MRESLGRAVNASDLQGCDWRSTSLDKIHALGLAKGLPEMIHFLDGLQPKSYKALTYEVAKQARLNISRGPLHKLCRLAIFETCFHFCQDCLGAKELMADQLRIVCHTCAGSGVRRYTDQSRAHFMGMDIAQYQKGWNNRLQTVLRVLNDRYKIATQTAKDRLYD